MIIEECPIVTDENYKKYIIQPMTVLEIMALDIGPIMNAFFEDGLSDVNYYHICRNYSHTFFLIWRDQVNYLNPN